MLDEIKAISAQLGLGFGLSLAIDYVLLLVTYQEIIRMPILCIFLSLIASLVLIVGGE